MIDFVNVEHLRHLVLKGVSDQAMQAKLLLLLAGTPGRVQVLTHLESLTPGLSERLGGEYTDRGSASVHVFRLPVYEGCSRQDLLDDATAKLKRDVGNGARHQVDADSMDLGAHVAFIQVVDGKMLDVEIDLVEEQLYAQGTRFEHKHNGSQIVRVRVYLDHPDHLAEVHAGAAVARTAMEGLMTHVFGRRQTSSRDKPFRPFAFNDTNVRMLATRLGLKQCEGEGAESPEKKNGSFRLKGRVVAGKRLPLDRSERLAQVVMDAMNNERMYLFNFEHGDGFLEEGTVEFKMKNLSQPGLQFLGRTSVSAKLWILNELR